MNFHNFFTIYVFEVGESIADTPTKLTCLSDLAELRNLSVMSSCYSDFRYLDWFWRYGQKTEPLCRYVPFVGVFFDPLAPTQKNSKF